VTSILGFVQVPYETSGKSTSAPYALRQLANLGDIRVNKHHVDQLTTTYGLGHRKFPAIRVRPGQGVTTTDAMHGLAGQSGFRESTRADSCPQLIGLARQLVKGTSPA
jgi:hypothetical protein